MQPLAKVEKFNGTYARMTALVWYRDDLQISDHFALHTAAQSHASAVFVDVLDDRAPGIRPLGGAARWWAGAVVARPAGEPA
jgi:deoxyribodipyrimidine photolyase